MRRSHPDAIQPLPQPMAGTRDVRLFLLPSIAWDCVLGAGNQRAAFVTPRVTTKPSRSSSRTSV